MPRPFAASIATMLLFYPLVAPEFAIADRLDRRIIGAWAQSTSDCKQVFEMRNGKMTFRRPVNEFIPAFIIGEHEIVATNGQCRVGTVVAKEGHIIASLSCNNSIGFGPVSARFKVISESEIMYGSTDNPMLDSAYERCR